MKKFLLILLACLATAVVVSTSIVGYQSYHNDEGPFPNAKPGKSEVLFTDDSKVASVYDERNLDAENPGIMEGGEPLPKDYLTEGFPTPLATANQEGCNTRLIQNNTSARSFSPSMFVEHYTVSANKPGWADMDAMFNWFNNPGSQVSSHYIIDFEGHCYLIVPESVKAWTQGNFNSASIAIEFIATGSESKETWLTDGAEGLKKGAKVTAAAMKRWNIPLKRIDPVECNIGHGYTDHNSLECGNDHHDVAPNFPWSKFSSLIEAEFVGQCHQFVLRRGKEVFARSPKFRDNSKSKAKMNAFLDRRDDLLLRKSGKGITLRKTAPLCG